MSLQVYLLFILLTCIWRIISWSSQYSLHFIPGCMIVVYSMNLQCDILPYLVCISDYVSMTCFNLVRYLCMDACCNLLQIFFSVCMYGEANVLLQNTQLYTCIFVIHFYTLCIQMGFSVFSARSLCALLHVSSLSSPPLLRSKSPFTM